MSYLEYFDTSVMEVMVRALFLSHHRNQAAYDPAIGNTPTSFGVSAWQSNMFFLEQGLGSIIDAEVHRSGGSFHVAFPTCRVSFYKFGSSANARAANFRLDGQRSLKRQSIVENNQMSLFGYTMDRSAQPIKMPEIVVVYSGNADEGLLEVHVGAPISFDRAQDGWLWLEQVYMKDEPGSDSIQVGAPTPTPTTPAYTEMKPPIVNVEVLPDDGKEMPNG
jgi:hypothetical protein